MTFNFIMFELVKIFHQRHYEILFEEFEYMNLPTTHSILLELKNYDEKEGRGEIDKIENFFQESKDSRILVRMIKVNDFDTNLIYALNANNQNISFVNSRFSYKLYHLTEFIKWSLNQTLPFSLPLPSSSSSSSILLSKSKSSIPSQLSMIENEKDFIKVNFDYEFSISSSLCDAFNGSSICTYIQDKLLAKCFLMEIISKIIFKLSFRRQYILQIKYLPIKKSNNIQINIIFKDGIYFENIKNLIADTLVNAKLKLNKIKKSKLKKKNQIARKMLLTRGKFIQNDYYSIIKNSISLVKSNDMILVKRRLSSDINNENVFENDNDANDSFSFNGKIHGKLIKGQDLNDQKKSFQFLVKNLFESQFIDNINIIGFISRNQIAIFFIESIVDELILPSFLSFLQSIEITSLSSLTFQSLSSSFSSCTWKNLEIPKNHYKNNKELEDLIIVNLLDFKKCRIDKIE